jgi:hypothetical protein
MSASTASTASTRSRSRSRSRSRYRSRYRSRFLFHHTERYIEFMGKLSQKHNNLLICNAILDNQYLSVFDFCNYDIGFIVPSEISENGSAFTGNITLWQDIYNEIEYKFKWCFKRNLYISVQVHEFHEFHDFHDFDNFDDFDDFNNENDTRLDNMFNIHRFDNIFNVEKKVFFIVLLFCLTLIFLGDL